MKTKRRERDDFRGYTHCVFTIASMYWLYDLLQMDQTNIVYGLFWLILGSLFPDMDFEFAPLGKINPFVGFMKHRGRIHTIFVSILFFVPVWLYNYVWGHYFLYGMISHILLDSITPMGIMILYPFNKKMYSLRLAKTGGFGELFIFATAIMYLAYL